MDERIQRTVATYEDVAEQYQSLHADRSDVAPVVEGFRERVAAAASDGTAAGGDGRSPRVVDVGCGPGWETATLREAGFDVLAADITPSFLAAVRDRTPGARFLRADMRDLPLAADVADGVFALASILHVPEAEVDDALAEFARVLGDGGVLTVVTKRAGGAAPDSPYGERDRRHVEFYEAGELRERIERAGFAIDSLDGDDRWLLVHARLP